MLASSTPTLYLPGYSAYVVGERQRTEATLQIYTHRQPVMKVLSYLSSYSEHLLDIYA